MNKKRFLLGMIILLIISIGSIWLIKPVIDKTNFGLDLQGGFEVLYEITPLNSNDELTDDMLYNTYKAVLKRIDILGVSEPEITIEGDNRIRVKLAGVTDAETARRTIASTATLSFRDYSDRLLMTSDVLGGKAEVINQEGKYVISLKIKDVDTFYEVTKKVKNMTNNQMIIWLDFDEELDSYRKELRKKELDPTKGCGSDESHCLSDPFVDKAFASDVVIQGSFTKDEAEALVELINSGAMPTKLTELSSRVVEASFGERALNKTLLAGAIGIILVMLIMICLYRFCGLIAAGGLLLYTFLTFLIFYLIEGVLTLPGIAAILLGIGMAVDANIIIFERIKENLLIGKNLDEAYEIGNKTSLASIIDANITTIIAAIIMFIFGESSVKGFATMLIISIITTVIVMVYLVRFIIKLNVGSHVFNKHLGLFIGINKKKIKKSNTLDLPFKKLDVVKNKKMNLGLTVVLVVVGLIIFGVTGASYGIDFTGGTSVTVNDKLEDAQKLLLEKEYTIKKIEGKTLYISEYLQQEEIDILNSALNDDLGIQGDIYVVSKIVKQELVKNAFKSLLLACIGIIIYVAIRFRFNYAVSAIIALVHDVLMTFLFFAVFKIEINSLFIAGILTIIGYSINDTIVTFDVIRDNYKRIYKDNITDIKQLDELVNISLRRTLFRNILTTITSIVPVIILICFGAKEIFNFNVSLLVGFVFGAYSSIGISNIIWLWLEKRRILKPKKIVDDDEVQELKVKGINC